MEDINYHRVLIYFDHNTIIDKSELHFMNFVKKMFYGNKITELIEIGNNHLEEENYFSAISYYSQALEINNENEEALFIRAKSYLSAKNYDKAQNDLEMLVNINPDYNEETYYLLTKSCLNQNKYSKASEYADKYYSSKPGDVKTQYGTARSKYFNKEYKEALKITDLLLAQNHEDFEPRYLRSMILFADKNFVSALQEIDKAISLNTLNGYLFNLRGLINIQLLNYQEAIDDFDYAIRLEPTNNIYYFNKAKIQFRIGDLPSANESISNSIEIYPDQKVSYLLKADIELALDEKLSALISYNMALELDNDDVKLISRIVELKIDLFDYEGAKVCLQKLLDLNKDDAKIYFIFAEVEFKLGNDELAVHNLKNAIEINSGYKDAILQKGILDYWNNRFEDSIVMFNSLIKIDSTFTKAIYYKVRALIKLGKYDEAEDELNIIEESKRDKDYMLLNSYVKLSRENIDEAQLLILDYLKSGSNSNSIKILANTLRLEQGNYKDVEELNEFQFEGELKESAQIINGITSFDKGQFNSAKYRLSNLNELSKEKIAVLKPFLDYAQAQIS